MNLFKKLKKLLTFLKKKEKGMWSRSRFIYNKDILGSKNMSSTDTLDIQTQTEKIICPTCDCFPTKETLALKQIRINQKLDDTTNDAIVIPYYSLVPPFHSFEEENKNPESENTTGEFSNRTFLGVMSNKKGKSAIKKLYLSVYGTIENVDEDEKTILLKPLADYDKETGQQKKPCVSGLELLVSACNLIEEDKESLLEKGEGLILGKRMTNIHFLDTNFHIFFKGQTKLQGIRCSYSEKQISCYDKNLDRVQIHNLLGKLVVAILDYCIIDGGKQKFITLHFVRILGEEEGKKATELVQKYYYG